MRQVSFSVDGFPPAKNEAKSMLAAAHMYADRVLRLLEASRAALGDAKQPLFPTERLGLELLVTAPSDPPSDATNYLGGVGDVLEVKRHRGALDHLGELANVAIYTNDRQIDEVRYRYRRGDRVEYSVHLWVLDEESAS